MYKAIFLLLIDLILIAASIYYINRSSFDIKPIALFLFIIFILFPLLIFAIYLLVKHIEIFVKNKNTPAIFKYFYYSLKIIYGLLLIFFGTFVAFYNIRKGLDSWIVTIFNIAIVIYAIKIGVSIIYKSLLSFSKT